MTAKEFSVKAWDRVKAAAKWVGLKLMGPGAALLVVAVAIVLFSLGWKKLQIGGILGRLLGRKSEGAEPVGIINDIPEGRVGEDGKPIPLGTPDAQGHTQVAVVPIEQPGLFSDPHTVKFTPPGGAQAVELKLPVGVTNDQVGQVVVVRPEVFAVTVKDNSGIKAEKVSDMLAKYGGGK